MTKQAFYREVQKEMVTFQTTLADVQVDWEKRNNALLKIEEYWNSGKQYDDFVPMFLPLLEELRRPFSTQIEELRSQIVNQQCHLLEVLARDLGPQLQKVIREVLPSVLQQTNNGTRLIAEYAQNCLVVLVQYVPSRWCLQHILTTMESSRSRVVRETCVKCLQLILSNWQQDPVQANADKIQSTLKNYLSDASQTARQLAQKCVWLFLNQCPDRQSTFLESLDERTRKQLNAARDPSDIKEEERKSGTTSNPPSRPTSATRATRPEKKGQSSTSEADAAAPNLKIGDRVVIQDKPGIVRYLGAIQNTQGSWVGIELDKPEGKNNGSVQGVQYFKAQPKHGLFARPHMVQMESASGAARASISTPMRARSATAPNTSATSATPNLAGSKSPAANNGALGLNKPGATLASSLSTEHESPPTSIEQLRLLKTHRVYLDYMHTVLEQESQLLELAERSNSNFEQYVTEMSKLLPWTGTASTQLLEHFETYRKTVEEQTQSQDEFLRQNSNFADTST